MKGVVLGSNSVRFTSRVVNLILAGLSFILAAGQMPHSKASDFGAPRSIAASRSPDQPEYVGRLADNFIFGILYKKPKPEWILFGVEHRNRLQQRDQNYRSSILHSQLLLLGRTLIYAGIRDVYGPLEFDFEVINSRDIGGDAPDSSRNLNYLDLHQAYANFHFQKEYTFFSDFNFRAGRMSFDFVDRRLIARNRFRNTINNFDGFRFQGTTNDSIFHSFDVFATRPVELHKTGFDKTSNDQFLYGFSTTVKSKEKNAIPIFEPYWINHRTRAAGNWGNRYTLGIHFYNDFLHSKFGFLDSDHHFAYQFGADSMNNRIRAWAAHTEFAYNFNAKWNPRLATWFNISTGDPNPNDTLDSSFDGLFGATHGFFGFTGFFDWQNVINPAAQMSLQPTDRLSLDAIFRAYWLHSPESGWERTNRPNPVGNKSSHIGEELDLRMRFRISDMSRLETGVGLFFPGEFSDISGQSPFATFVYSSITLSL